MHLPMFFYFENDSRENAKLQVFGDVRALTHEDMILCVHEQRSVYAMSGCGNVGRNG